MLQEGATALYIASLKGHLQIAEALVRRGASVHLADKNGATPLHMISEHSDAAIARLLLDAGADVNAVNQVRCFGSASIPLLGV